MNRGLIIGIVATGFLLSCDKDEGAPVDLGLAYFPTEIGKYVDFQVDSVFVDEQFAAPTVEVSYQMRELIAADFQDAQGRQAQRLERYVKDSTGTWLIRDVWYQYRSSSVAERVEENVRKLRMVFRPDLIKRWDLNALNPEDAREMRYEVVDQSMSLNGFNFDSTLVVNTTYTNNLVDTIIDLERYAKHVGLVQKQWVETNSQYDSANQEWETTGWRVTYNLIGYGAL